jgi:hypothetical protein
MRPLLLRSFAELEPAIGSVLSHGGFRSSTLTMRVARPRQRILWPVWGLGAGSSE